MTETMNDERALAVLRDFVRVFKDNHSLSKSVDHIAARLAQQAVEPMFTASMYGSAKEAEKARIAAQHPAASQPGQVAVPPDWQLVPKVPTRAMLEATMVKGTANDKTSLSVRAYEAMLAAAPQPAGKET